MSAVTYKKRGAASKIGADSTHKVIMTTRRDWRQGYGPAIDGASESREFDNNYANSPHESRENENRPFPFIPGHADI
jgi:hypothetical protein